MVTIPEVVEEIIKNKPFIEEALAEGVVNLSSLSRKIQPEIESRVHKQVKLGAIVMALKRLTPSLNPQMDKSIRYMFNNLGDIIVRSNIIDFTYRNSDSLIERQKELFRLIDQRKNKDIFCTFSQGVYETTLVSSALIEKEIENIFREEFLITKIKDLSSITVNLPDRNQEISGIYYFFFKKIAWAGVNILEIVSTTHEFTFVLNDKDVDAAFSIVKNFKTIERVEY